MLFNGVEDISLRCRTFAQYDEIMCARLTYGYAQTMFHCTTVKFRLTLLLSYNSFACIPVTDIKTRAFRIAFVHLFLFVMQLVGVQNLNKSNFIYK